MLFFYCTSESLQSRICFWFINLPYKDISPVAFEYSFNDNLFIHTQELIIVIAYDHIMALGPTCKQNACSQGFMQDKMQVTHLC